MKRLIWHIVLFLTPFLLGIIVLFLIPVDKKFSYHFLKGECNDKASWIYNRIFENEKTIDIAFSGASHTGCAIIDNYIEDRIRKETGKRINVANLGYCRGGRDIQYLMLKDLFEYKNPQYLIVDVPEDEPKKSHPVFPYLADSHELFASFVLFNQRYFSGIWKGLSVRFEYLKYKLFRNNIESYKYSDYGYISSEVEATKEALLENKQIWEQRLLKQKSDVLRKIELNYSKHYLQKIAELAKNNNCKLFFLYLPESGSQLASPFLFEYYEKSAQVILLPETVTNNPENWMDPMHFNDSGAKQVSDFLVGKISLAQ